MPKIQAVLFDLDGTILDTFELMCQAFEYAFSSSNLSVPSRAQIQTQMASGGTLETIYANLNPLAQAPGLAMLHRHFESTHLQLGQPFADTIAVLQNLQSSGFQLAIVSNRSAITLNQLIDLTGLRQFFSIIISGDDTSTPKPNPQPVLLALNHLKITASKAIMVGDTSADVNAGKNAGTFTVGLTAGFSGQNIRVFQPDLVAPNLSALLPFISFLEA